MRNRRFWVLDRAVDAYTKEGGRGLSERTTAIRKGQELREQQKPQA